MITTGQMMTALVATQHKVIRSWMKQNYVGGGAKIRKWDDDMYWISRFLAKSVKVDLTNSHVRKRLIAMANDGYITAYKANTNRHTVVQFRLPRLVCDEIAVDVEKELMAEGYNYDTLVKL